MNIKWFRKKENQIEINSLKEFEQLSKALDIKGLEGYVASLREVPNKKSEICLRGGRNAVRLLVPNRYFGEEIEFGTFVWIYIGPSLPSYILTFETI